MSGSDDLRSCAPAPPATAPDYLFGVLRLFAGSAATYTAEELAGRLGAADEQVHGLLAGLERDGYLVRAAERRYRQGPQLKRLRDSFTLETQLPLDAGETLNELHRSTSAAAYYALVRGRDILIAHIDDCPLHPRIAETARLERELGAVRASGFAAHTPLLAAPVRETAMVAISPDPERQHPELLRGAVLRCAARIEAMTP